MHGLHGYYTLREVCHLTTLSETTIRRRMKAQRFPQSDRMSPRRIAWLKKAIHRWMALGDRWRPEDEIDEDDDED